MLNLGKQWPFWISGVFVGIAETMNYMVLEKPIGLTTGLVEMTAAFEHTVAPEIDCLNVDFREDLARDTTISRTKHVPDIFSHDPMIQALVGLAYGVLVAGLLVWSIRSGMRLTGFSCKDLMTHANDELTIKYFDRMAQTSDDPDVDRKKETAEPGLDGAVTEGA